MNGVLIINKPRGWTSHDVVAKVRRLLGVAKAGHTGTLDPLATGVLVVCVGKATRLARYLESDDKEYEAEIRLGTITDTLDTDGRILETKVYESPSEKSVREALNAFTGVIKQRPPSFSAIKIHGIPSHRLARSGDARELPERQVTIFSLELLHYQDPCIRVAVRCSKGTYIRSLAADIGDRLGAGACLSVLIRTKAGAFGLERAITIEQLADLVVKNETQRVLLPPAEVLNGFSSLKMSEQECRLVAHGNAVTITDDRGEIGNEEQVCLLDRSGSLIAVGKRSGSTIQPEVVLV
ncbi:MAG: tRNA pseudouridine(55) synthase TruB [Nitrospirota bacterium]|nr:tRNA pseudouridine(55) synthase TruB [Nitrospirota bacterium]